MRIGIISSGTIFDRVPPIYGGGIQKYVWNLGRYLKKSGHIVHIFAKQQPGQLKEEFLDGIHIHRISNSVKMKTLSTFIFGLKVLLKILQIQKKEGRFHILHAQSRVSGLIIRSFLRDLPFLITAHNWDIALTSPGRFLHGFTYAIIYFIEKRVYSQCNAIITLTSFFQRVLHERYNIPLTKTYVIPNMVDIEAIEWKTNKIQPSPKKIFMNPYLLFIGRLEQEKGCDYLIKKFNILAKQNPSVQLVFIGSGTLKSNLNKIKKALNCGDRIHILGVLHESQLCHLLKKANALILPSQFELMPTVVLEAWAAGCPVIVNRFLGIHGFIHHKSTGLLFRLNNSSQLLVNIQELLRDQELKQKIIQNAKILVTTKYNAPHVVKQILKIYRKLIARCN
ncbi:MAG: glycosyltransferase family 4 protein [Candidatus Helarchaeota archaeon]